MCTGLSEANGSWKISWTCRTYERKDRPRPAFTAFPSSRISPSVSGYSWASSRATVDLPGAGLPHQGRDRAAPQLQRDVVDGVDGAAMA